MRKVVDLLSTKLYLKIKKKQSKEKVKIFEDYLKKNKKYKNKHRGERCFIIASGPSINGIDFSLFKDEITFTVNQIVRNQNFDKLNTNYHLWADRIFFEIDEENEEDLEMLDIIKSVNKKSPKAEVFYESMAKKMIDKFYLEKDNNVNYFQVIDLSPSHMERELIDFSEPVPNYPTVVDHAILLAVYMGVSEIYLLGCDCTGIINIAQNKLKNAINSLYAFEMSDKAAKRLERYSSQRNMKDELYSQAAIFAKYEELNRYCERNGVKLFNATKGGLLDCLDRVDLNEVL